MNVGFIGAGSMGSLLIEAFIMSEALQAEQIFVSNRTFSKAESLAYQFPGLTASLSNIDIALQCDIIFLCIKPLEFSTVLQQISPFLRAEQLVVSITSPVLLKNLSEMIPTQIAKIIPSITNRMWNGSTLCIFDHHINEPTKKILIDLLSYIGEPIEIEESFTRIVSDISSCGPAFFSFFLEQFAIAAEHETGISREEAIKIGSHMLLGTGLLLTEGGLTPGDIQNRVAVPGGITAKALQLLKQSTEGIFNTLIHTTHEKYYEDVDLVNRSFKKEVSES